MISDYVFDDNDDDNHMDLMSFHVAKSFICVFNKSQTTKWHREVVMLD